MQLINTDEMVFIGPGSEWFWTALTGLVLGVTFIAIYRQLTMEAAANATARIESVWASWSTFDMQYRVLVLALYLKYEADRQLGDPARPARTARLAYLSAAARAKHARVAERE